MRLMKVGGREIVSKVGGYACESWQKWNTRPIKMFCLEDGTMISDWELPIFTEQDKPVAEAMVRRQSPFHKWALNRDSIRLFE